MKLSLQNTLTIVVPATQEALPERLRVVALTELTRRRRLLGEMTKEQEHALEALIVSTVERISERIAEISRRRCASVEKAQA